MVLVEDQNCLKKRSWKYVNCGMRVNLIDKYKKKQELLFLQYKEYPKTIIFLKNSYK